MSPALVGGFFTIEPPGESHKVNTKVKRQCSNLMHKAGHLKPGVWTTHRDGVGGQGAMGGGRFQDGGHLFTCD